MDFRRSRFRVDFGSKFFKNPQSFCSGFSQDQLERCFGMFFKCQTSKDHLLSCFSTTFQGPSMLQTWIFTGVVLEMIFGGYLSRTAKAGNSYFLECISSRVFLKIKDIYQGHPRHQIWIF